MHRIELYNYLFINFINFQKIGFVNKVALNTFSESAVSVSLNNLKFEEDVTLVDAAACLENIFNQKVVLKKGNYAYVGSTKIFRAALQTSLRKKNMFFFLDYLLLTVIPNYERRYGLFSFSKSKSTQTVEISINDFSLFINLSQNLPKTLKLKIFIKNKSATLQEMENYFRFFGLLLK